MLLNLLLLVAPPPSTGPSPSLLGDWITPNKSIVQIYKCESGICARIAYVDPGVGHTTDGKNPNPSLRDRSLCGLKIGNGFQEKDATHAEDGKLYDPESGNTYSGTLTLLSDATLKLRGYIGIALFGRTEDWKRAQTTVPSCKATERPGD